MYKRFRLIIKYLHYLATAANGNGHGIHSPFVFKFITTLLNDKRSFYCYKPIENLRRELQTDKTELLVADFGAGSLVEKSRYRQVANIARSSLKPKKYAQLLFRMVNAFESQTIVELGTSLGVTSAYLASANSSAKVYTFEGAKEVAALANKNLRKLQLHNVEIIEGNFDDTLAPILAKISKVDLAFIDGNHRKQPTLNYFKQLLEKATDNSVFVLDDIHWSEEMEEAWKCIIQHPSVTLSIDLFFIGIVFFRKENLIPQHFTIRF